MLATVSVARYINVINSEFKSNKQRGKTCHVNAIAAVYHLAMNQVVGREGGYPEFTDILENLTEKYWTSKADIENVLAKTCSNYRLHFNELKD